MFEEKDVDFDYNLSKFSIEEKIFEFLKDKYSFEDLEQTTEVEFETVVYEVYKDFTQETSNSQENPFLDCILIKERLLSFLNDLKILNITNEILKVLQK